MSELKKQMSAANIFKATQETFEDAQKKSAAESGNRSKYYRITSDGTYAIRILPLAPTIDKDGNVIAPDRKGYEYPVKEMLLKITGKDSKGKQKEQYASICNVNHAYPDLKCDLIDEYVTIATDKHSDDEALIKKIKESGFNGGLKWSSNRCMYVLDAEKRSEGPQVFSLSYSQYKDLEGRKIQIWEKLLKKSDVLCPISSIEDAYFVEITRKTENKKTSYSFTVDTVSGTDPLSDEELETLLNTPRLPEVIYKYSRWHLEATIAFLHQFDEKHGMNIMSDPRIEECISKIKMALPSDDNSHFSFDQKNSGENKVSGVDALWEKYDKLQDSGFDDRSEEGQDLRADIKEFIDENELDVEVSRKKTNLDLLKEIEDALDETTDKENGVDDEKELDSDSNDDGEEDKDQEPESSRSSRRGRNSDISEPAERPERRGARPERRRR